MPQNYKEISARELREMLLNNTLNVDLMDLEEYEKLFGYEIELDEPSDVVLSFCNKCLEQYEYYGVDIPIPSYNSILQKHNARSKSKKAAIGFPVKPKRFVIIIAAILAALFLIAATAAAFGYNVLNMLINTLHSPKKEAINYDGNTIFRTDDTRTYNSLDELLEVENLKILYPAKLPDGYAFTDFRVSDYGRGLEILLFSVDSFVEFHVCFGVNYPVESIYETNNITYNVFETNGYNQAEWNYGEDYYTIAVDDESTLLEIINNLISED